MLIIMKCFISVSVYVWYQDQKGQGHPRIVIRDAITIVAHDEFSRLIRLLLNGASEPSGLSRCSHDSLGLHWFHTAAAWVPYRDRAWAVFTKVLSVSCHMFFLIFLIFFSSVTCHMFFFINFYFLFFYSYTRRLIHPCSQIIETTGSNIAYY